MQTKKIIPIFLCVFLVFSLIPKLIQANSDTSALALDLNKPFYYLKGEVITINATSNMSIQITLTIYWNWKTFSDNKLIYNNTKTANATWNLPTINSDVGYYRFVASNGNQTIDTWRTLIHATNYSPTTLPLTYMWQAVNYTFTNPATLNATHLDDFISIVYTTLPFPYSASIFTNNMSFLIRLTGNNWDVDISYWLIYPGLKWVLNGTIPTTKSFDFQCNNNPSKIWKPLTYEFKSLNTYLSFSWQDLVIEQHTFTFNVTTQILTVTIPDSGSFKIDPYIFEDGFESGDFTTWTATVGTPTIVTTPVHHGTYAAYCNANSESCQKTYTEVTNAYARFYVYFLSYGTGPLYFARFFRVEWDYALRVGLSATNHYWQITAAGKTVVVDTITPDLNTWYCVEMKYTKNTSEGASLWIDGVLRLISDTTNYASNRFDLWAYDAGFGTVSIYYDCVVIDSAYIGVEVSGINLVVDLFQNVNVYAALYQLKEIGNTFWNPVNVFSNVTMLKALGFRLFQAVNVFSNISMLKALQFKLFQNANLWSSLGILTTAGQNYFVTLFEALRVSASSGMGIGTSVYLFELPGAVMPFSGLTLGTGSSDTTILYGLAGLGIILALTALAIALTKRD